MCSGCKQMHYCGKECQRDDWRAGHKEECKYFATPKFVQLLKTLTRNRLLLLRLLLNCKRQINGTHIWDVEHTIYDGTKRSFRSLVSGVEREAIQKEALSDWSDKFKDPLGATALGIEYEDLLEAFGNLWTSHISI